VGPGWSLYDAPSDPPIVRENPPHYEFLATPLVFFNRAGFGSSP